MKNNEVFEHDPEPLEYIDPSELAKSLKAIDFLHEYLQGSLSGSDQYQIVIKQKLED